MIRTTYSSEPPIDHDGIKNDFLKSPIYNHHITQVTTATVDNNRFTTIYTLEIHSEKKKYVIHPSIVYRRIFDAI